MQFMTPNIITLIASLLNNINNLTHSNSLFLFRCEYNYNTISYLVSMPRGKKRKTEDIMDEEFNMDYEDEGSKKKLEEVEGISEVIESSDDEELDLAELMA